MANKRGAVRELNHDNWNEEEEEEDVGEFKKASEDVLVKRVRKVAKRRTGGNEGSVDVGKVTNPFSGFDGFGSNAQVASTPLSSSAMPFNFLSKIPIKTQSDSVITPTTPKTNGENNPNNDSKFTEYNGKVKALNIAFTAWIKSHVDENALCDLRPIFADYEKYMSEFGELKKKFNSTSDDNKKKETIENTLQSPPISLPTVTFSFGNPPSTSNTSSIQNIFSSVNTSSVFSSNTQTLKEPSPVKSSTNTESKNFSFGLPTATVSSQAAVPTFSFGLQKNSSTMPNTSIFGNVSSISSTPFSFSNVIQTKTNPTENEEEAVADTEEEPPKNEFVPVVEEDSLFSKRCKIFVKTGTDYVDRGVGTLFLKRVDDKVQLIVRADTNLGNILLNIILQEGLPTSRLGKNNVMIVCVPTPESKPPPTPVLVRVKTGEEADELLSILEKYKNGD